MGDQAPAVKNLVKGIQSGDSAQVLMGITGSGKTFTVAHVINELNRPVLVLSHNKTLAAQLYGEFKQFFPKNAVEYFISYYDYYRPEAYLPVSDVYVEKELSINEEIEKLRLSATSSLLSRRRDVIIVASVSCIYGIGNPKEISKYILTLRRDESIDRNQLLHRLVEMLYVRTDSEFRRSTFRIKGDTLDIFPAYSDSAYRLIFWENTIEEIYQIRLFQGKRYVQKHLLRYFRQIFL